MKLKPIPKSPKVVLLANDLVGLEVAKYLSECKEKIVALVLHPKSNERFSSKIKSVLLRGGLVRKNIFYADQLRDPVYLEKISKLNPGLAISAWFGHVLKKNFIDIFPSGVINFHNSYLPYNRGKYPHVWALYDESKYGVSLHYIDEKIDTGKIITRQEIRAMHTDIAGSLYDISLHEIIKLFIKTWPALKKNKIRPISQNKNGTHHFAKEVERLDFIDIKKRYLGKDLINQLRSRSFKNRSYAYFLHEGKRVYIKVTLSERPNF
ncbi:MAG: formyltransferase family protein [bacterium]|nr:formyltransferase family protein [bacterium]